MRDFLLQIELRSNPIFKAFIKKKLNKWILLEYTYISSP